MRKGLLVVPVITLLVLCVMLAACAPAEPQIVEKTVVETVIVEKEVVIEKPVPETVIVEKEVPVEKLVVQTVIVEIEKEIIVTPEPAEASTRITTVDIPFEELWAESGHADRLAEAFVHWNEDAEQIVPAGCANCHSTTGYLDYLGADGSEIWSVDNEHPIGSTVECVACHNAATQKLDSVLFPSGVEITGLGAEARCMVCHQGRTYLGSVDAAIEGAGVPDDDTPSGDIRFVNIHYFSAGATEYGSLTHGGYEYPGMAYDGRLDHVAEFDTCIECHDPHTLEINIESCAECHVLASRLSKTCTTFGRGVPSKITMAMAMSPRASTTKWPVCATRYIRRCRPYAANNIATPLAYDSNRYPYFFIDANEDGSVGEDESGGFNAWTGRLLKAAYNYQLATKDPGGYAHGGKYLIQLLFDSIEDLNRVLDTPIDMSAAQRDDAGHFAGSSEAFRHWDADGMVSASCTKCHTGTGLPFYLEHGVSIEQTPTNGLMCITCHDNLTGYTIHTVETVTFPSGATLDSESPQTNLCLNCHQGRESGASVRNLIGDLDDDETSDTLRFLNVHYFAAGASLFGARRPAVHTSMMRWLMRGVSSTWLPIATAPIVTLRTD